MSVTRSALLDDLRAFRRDVNARLDVLERKLLDRPESPQPRPTARVSSPSRRSPQRRPSVGRWCDQSPIPRPSFRMAGGKWPFAALRLAQVRVWTAGIR